VLVICGASGTGKTATAFEVGQRLQELGIRHAVVDTDELDRVWPLPQRTEDLVAISRQNLSALWRTFSHLGTQRVVLCGVMASHAESERWIADAIEDSDVTYVRLVAERKTREQRLRRREIGSGFQNDMKASDAAATFIERHDPPEMPRVRTDGKSVAAVSVEVLRVSNWLDGA